MSEKPILFSGTMVRSILAGSKSQTRRVLNNPEYYGCPTGDCPHSYQSECNAAMQVLALPDVRIKAGDTLWVREAWRTLSKHDAVAPRDLPRVPIIGYDADYQTEPNDGYRGKGRPSIHMPRWASRITLKVTGVKVERLQDISEDDAIAEGIHACEPTQDDPAEYAAAEGRLIYNDPREAFCDLWISINGADSWEANPWVVAYSFQRIKP